MERINVRGINFCNVTLAEAVAEAARIIENRGKSGSSAVYTPNAEICQTCLDDKEKLLAEVINSADIILPDGAGVVLASKILKTPLKERVAGIDFAVALLDYLDKSGGSLFLFGASQESVEAAKENIEKKYPGVKITGIRNGYFDPGDAAENAKIAASINAAAPDVVFVCLGAPKQERWIYSNRGAINSAMLIGLGGTIDVIAGKAKRAPAVFIKLNLEWFYRLCKNPSRLPRMMKLPKYIIGSFLARGKNKKIRS